MELFTFEDAISKPHQDNHNSKESSLIQRFRKDF